MSTLSGPGLAARYQPGNPAHRPHHPPSRSRPCELPRPASHPSPRCHHIRPLGVAYKTRHMPTDREPDRVGGADERYQLASDNYTSGSAGFRAQGTLSGPGSFRLASWVTFCPGNNISARKRKHGRTLPPFRSRFAAARPKGPSFRVSPAVKTSVLWARHQSSRWLAQRLYLRPSRRSYPGARRKRPTAFYFPDVRPRVCCRRASLGDRVCSQGHPCRAGWTTAGGGIGFVYANCSISPAPACSSGIGSGRAQGQRKAGRGRPAVET
jgi:hypothetical protein